MKKKNSTKSLDEAIDNGESLLKHFKQVDGIKRVNVDFPLWMVLRMDREAERLGITRQSLIKLFIAEKLDQMKILDDNTRKSVAA